MEKAPELAQIAISRKTKNVLDEHCRATGQRVGFVLEHAIKEYLATRGAVLRQSFEDSKKK